MVTVIVVIHLLIALAMIGLILMQKTEGNASGGGLSSNVNLSSMMAPRPRANPLTNATVVLGIMFFATSIGLALLSKRTGPAPSIFAGPADAPAAAGRVSDILGESAPPAAGAAPTTGAAPGSAPIAPAFPGSSAASPSAPPAVPQSGAPAVPNN